MRKKFLLICAIMLISGLFACGNPTANEATDASKSSDPAGEQVPADIIQPSSLISLNEAGEILKTELKAIEVDNEMPGGALNCVYDSEDNLLQIFIRQNSLMKGLNKEFGGTENYFNGMVSFQKEESPDFILEIENLGDEAYYMDLAETNRWSLHILKSGYVVELYLDGNGTKDWKLDILKEAGELAIKNLLPQI
ncbi:MAG: hypothetical protein ACOX4U_03045 [Anaerovoracaceae bacterium]